MMDALRFSIALAPLAVYAGVFGFVRLRSQPTVLSGALDTLLLGIGVIGLMVIGPIELFFPRAAFALLGNWVWALLIGLYLFALLLVALSRTPRLIVYGLDAEELRQQLQTMLQANAIEAHWLEDIVVLPHLGVRASIVSAGNTRIAQMTSTGQNQNIAGWYAMEKLLLNELKPSAHSSAPVGLLMLLVGVLLLGSSAGMLYADRVKLQQVMSAMFERE